VASHLGAALRFRTVSDDDHRADMNAALGAMRDWMAKTYPNFHKAASRELIGQSVLFVWKGAHPALKPILLLAHMDVAPIIPGTDESWSHGPFSGDVTGGYVWGRGSIDDKSSLVMILEAAERLAASGFTPSRTIVFAFSEDGESGGQEGDTAMAQTLAQRGVKFDYVLDEGDGIVDEAFPGAGHPAALIGIAEKGTLNLELVAHGEGGPSSRPTHDLAVVRLAQALLKVVNHPFSSGLDDIQREKFSELAPFSPFDVRFLLANIWLCEPIVERLAALTPGGAAHLHTTIAPTVTWGGIDDTMLPPDARAVVSFHLDPRDTMADVVMHVRRSIDDPKVDVVVLNQPKSEAILTADIHGQAYKTLATEIRDTFGDIAVAPDIAVDMTGSGHYVPLADAVLHFEPFRFGPDDLGRAHGTNERLAVRDLALAVTFDMRLMQDSQ
jgi:carboxypeptidase PM20D1